VRRLEHVARQSRDLCGLSSQGPNPESGDLALGE
jgi:hypothetical protein